MDPTVWSGALSTSQPSHPHHLHGINHTYKAPLPLLLRSYQQGAELFIQCHMKQNYPDAHAPLIHGLDMLRACTHTDSHPAAIHYNLVTTLPHKHTAQ